MRINRYIALSTGISRRAADKAVSESRVTINSVLTQAGTDVAETDQVALDGKLLSLPKESTTIMLNKPPGYVSSRSGQGSATVYELLPETYSSLKPIGRLDKESSGLLLLSDDGILANQLTHPSFNKLKLYLIKLDKALSSVHQETISGPGIHLNDGISKFSLRSLDGGGLDWEVGLSEGRNRQIRRTFERLGYKVISLHRIKVGPYQLGDLKPGEHIIVKP